jgi:hypothetical protein
MTRRNIASRASSFSMLRPSTNSLFSLGAQLGRPLRMRQNVSYARTSSNIDRGPLGLPAADGLHA